MSEHVTQHEPSVFVEGTPAENPQVRSPGAPIGNDNAQAHGFYSAKGFLERGLSAIPTESPLHSAVAELRQQIYADLGGVETLSRIAIDLIESYISTQLLERGIDAYGFELQSAGLSVIDRRSHRLRDLFASQRTSLLRLKLDIAKTLGLKRLPAAVPDWRKSLTEKVRQRQSSCEIRSEESGAG